MRSLAAASIAAVGLLIAGCGSSSPKASTPTTTNSQPDCCTSPTGAGTTPTTVGGAAGAITDPSGIRWSLRAGRPSLVSRYETSGVTATTVQAPPGQEYVMVPLAVTDTSNQPAGVLGILADVQGVGATVYLGVPTAQQPGDCATTQQGSLSAPTGFCLDSTDVVLADGTDVKDAENFNEDPMAQAGATVNATLYMGPVPTGFNLQGLEMLVETGGGSNPGLVAVPIG